MMQPLIYRTDQMPEEDYDRLPINNHQNRSPTNKHQNRPQINNHQNRSPINNHHQSKSQICRNYKQHHEKQCEEHENESVTRVFELRLFTVILLACLCFFGVLAYLYHVLYEIPTDCGPDEYLSDCDKSCEFNCVDGLKANCDDRQCLGGKAKCLCKNGLARLNHTSNECVKPEKCPTFRCGPNESYVRCVHSCGDTKCSELGSLCTLMGCESPSCVCQQGYARNHKHKCIPIELCPVECPQNEQWKACGRQCEASCNRPADVFCSMRHINCVPACTCTVGLLRVRGVCAHPSECQLDRVNLFVPFNDKQSNHMSTIN